MFLEEGFAMTSVFLGRTLFCPASFCTPRPNLPVTPGGSSLPTFAFQYPVTKRTSFGGVNSMKTYKTF